MSQTTSLKDNGASGETTGSGGGAAAVLDLDGFLREAAERAQKHNRKNKRFRSHERREHQPSNAMPSTAQQ